MTETLLEPSEHLAGLSGLDALAPAAEASFVGGRFRPTDPADEAHAQAVPSGLRQSISEDVDGLEDERPLRPINTDRTVVAIDAGVVRLGSTSNGVVVAARGAMVVCGPDRQVSVRTYRPGIFYVDHSNRVELFHQMGLGLGRPDFFVRLDDDGYPTEEKVRLEQLDHRVGDRIRNYLERCIQRQACEDFAGVTLGMDGALTLRTFDTPQVFLRRLHEVAEAQGNSLVAVSKKTGLTIKGTDIRLFLDREGGVPARRKLTSALRAASAHNGAHRALGDLYVARFAPGGETYRVDVDPCPGMTSAAALDEFASACLHRSGYPEPLVLAHAFCYMPPTVVAELQAYAIARYGFEVIPEPKLGPIFAPFGGRWK